MSQAVWAMQMGRVPSPFSIPVPFSRWGGFFPLQGQFTYQNRSRVPPGKTTEKSQGNSKWGN